MDILVAPMLIPKKSQLANIDYEFNGIMVRGDCTGDVVFYGKGAGKLPTASAVVADIIDCCKHLKTRKYLFWADGTNDSILPYNESETAVYLRLSAESKDNAIAKAKEVFGDVTVIEPKEEIAQTVAVVTPVLKIQEIESKASALESSGINVLSKIRVGDL